MLNKFREAVLQEMVLVHAQVVNVETQEFKTDSGSIVEGAGMWIVGLLGVALFLYGFRDIISTTILPSITTNIKTLFDNIPKP
ncbi:hypothetical protein [Acetobacterium sp.]|uniref:hypothetical protein n=1 Tax=Acetobacterium sp. TaxID=1872094 RepID=UPI0027226946|nr:hypothetical protein [Acetobacterium sp.]MDO9492008.1 hypothetical protein [Acetobacterium sp.]